MKKIPLLFILMILLSCQEKNQYSDAEVCKLLSEIGQNDQKFRFKLMDTTISKNTKDSLSKLQFDLDNENTELMLEIIHQKGWPNADSLNCNEPPPTIIVFRHAPKEYFDTIQIIIDQELKKGTIDGLNHMFIDNHLKGRPAFKFDTVE